MRFFWSLLLFVSLIGCYDDELNSNEQSSNNKKDTKIEKYCNGNKVKDEIISMATSGDANKQLTLGLIYDAGYCGVVDIKTAESWYLKSANQSHVAAQTTLGAFYISKEYHREYGFFNIEKSKYWLNKAINQNDNQAMFYMSAFYCDNTYGSEDMKKMPTLATKIRKCWQSKSKGYFIKISYQLMEFLCCTLLRILQMPTRL